MPSHTHTFSGNSHTHTLNGHTHSFSTTSGGSGSHSFRVNASAQANTVNLFTNLSSGLTRSTSGEDSYYNNTNRVSKSGMLDLLTVPNHTHSVSGTTRGNSGNTSSTTQGGTNSNTGGGTSHNNMPPYLTVYMWKRTA